MIIFIHILGKNVDYFWLLPGYFEGDLKNLFSCFKTSRTEIALLSVFTFLFYSVAI